MCVCMCVYVCQCVRVCSHPEIAIDVDSVGWTRTCHKVSVYSLTPAHSFSFRSTVYILILSTVFHTIYNYLIVFLLLQSYGKTSEFAKTFFLSSVVTSPESLSPPSSRDSGQVVGAATLNCFPLPTQPTSLTAETRLLITPQQRSWADRTQKGREPRARRGWREREREREREGKRERERERDAPCW